MNLLLNFYKEKAAHFRIVGVVTAIGALFLNIASPQIEAAKSSSC